MQSETEQIQQVHDCFRDIYKLSRKGKYAAALRLLYDARQDRIRPPYRIDSNHAWYCTGDLLHRQEKYAQALNAFRKSLRTRPDDAEALWAIADCYDELCRPKFAERYLRKALALQPKDSGLIYNLGNALFDQGRYEEAMALYRKIRKNAGDTFDKARKNLALAKSRLD